MHLYSLTCAPYSFEDEIAPAAHSSYSLHFHPSIPDTKADPSILLCLHCSFTSVTSSSIARGFPSTGLRLEEKTNQEELLHSKPFVVTFIDELEKLHQGFFFPFCAPCPWWNWIRTRSWARSRSLQWLNDGTEPHHPGH